MLTPLGRRCNKPEFANSPRVVLGFSSTGFCNVGSTGAGSVCVGGGGGAVLSGLSLEGARPQQQLNSP